MKDSKNISPIIFYAENIDAGHSVIQPATQTSKRLDFALDESFVTEDHLLERNSWIISQNPVHERRILNIGKRRGDFLSIALHENTYATFQNSGFRGNGLFTGEMAYPILKVILKSGSNEPAADRTVWLLFYIDIVLTLLHKDIHPKSPARFCDLKQIFKAVERLQTFNSGFTKTSEFMHRSGISVPLFQKGCLMLYGQPLQKIIHHLKMKQGIEDLLQHQKSIRETGFRLGYDHSANFITAFHRHFGIAPMQAIHFHRC